MTISPLPWHSNTGINIRSDDDRIVAGCWLADGVQNQKEAAANAAFIVTAVNAHDALVEALQNIMNGITSGAITTEYDETMERAVIKAHDALQLAKGA